MRTVAVFLFVRPQPPVGWAVGPETLLIIANDSRKETAMADETTGATAPKPKRERSPSFPFIPLKTAIARLAAFDAYSNRHPVPAKHSGSAWGMKGYTSQAQQTLAALKSFGLIEYHGTKESLTASITDDARTYLRAQQESIKQEVLKRVALKPKEMAKYFGLWGVQRPPDPVCLDLLVLNGGYTPDGAKLFLSVYDDTLDYAGVSDSDRVSPEDQEQEVDEADDDTPGPDVPDASLGKVKPTAKAKGTILMEGERILQDGILSREATYRIIVSGRIGAKEIERLIAKLELDKEILSEPEEPDEDDPSILG